MKIWPILSPAASLGLTAMGMPVAGMAAGSIFGALAANEMRKEQQEERKRAMLANADSIRHSYGRLSGQTPQLDVQPWMGEYTALGAGATQGVEQATEFAKLFKKDKDGVQVLGEEKPAATAATAATDAITRQVASVGEDAQKPATPVVPIKPPSLYDRMNTGDVNDREEQLREQYKKTAKVFSPFMKQYT